VRTVTITPTVGIPTAITISAGTEPTCQLTNGTTTTTYTATATDGTGFNWSLSDGAAGIIDASGIMTWLNGFYGTVDIQVTANGCNGPSSQVVRTVTVTPNMTVTAGPTTTLCINTALTTFTHTTTLATGITGNNVSGANGLPAGVSAHWATNTITISGTPTVSGTFNYSIPLTGGCGTINATGTINVDALPIITLTSAAATTNQTATNVSVATRDASGYCPVNSLPRSTNPPISRRPDTKNRAVRMVDGM
jgi:hypothetical protein